MFKQKCSKCNGKIDKGHSFCPFCGKDLKSKHDDEDFGFLGKNDFSSEDNNQMGFGGSFLDKIMNSAMKMVEKQMRDLPDMNQQNPNNPQNSTNPNPFSNFPRSNMRIKFMVNGKEIPINQPQQQTRQPKKVSLQQPQISEDKIKKLAKLPRKEPKTIMKRLSGKLVYELTIPGVKDVQDILINQLENSIEVKAIAKDKVYSKTLNINLPILRYTLLKGILILELQAK